MKYPARKGEEPLSTFALIVIGLEMLTVAGVLSYACTAAGNAGHAPAWFGEHGPRTGSPVIIDQRGPTGGR
jgi:hypothetical protein